MICYKDMTFCPFYKECKDGSECPRAVTIEIKNDAKKWLNVYPPLICQYTDKPNCFVNLK
jgi:hypothetical protein